MYRSHHNCTTQAEPFQTWQWHVPDTISPCVTLIPKKSAGNTGTISFPKPQWGGTDKNSALRRHRGNIRVNRLDMMANPKREEREGNEDRPQGELKQPSVSTFISIDHPPNSIIRPATVTFIGNQLLLLKKKKQREKGKCDMSQKYSILWTWREEGQASTYNGFAISKRITGCMTTKNCKFMYE